MMPLDPLTIVFALVAIIVIWKLRSVLGERTGLERQRDSFFGRPSGRGQAPNGAQSPSTGAANVVRLPGTAVPPADPNRWRDHAAPGSAVAAGLDGIAHADPAFSIAPFLEGANTAYEAIVTAFAAGERKTLQTLLAKDVYDGFDAAIVERERLGHRLSTTFVSVDDAKLEAAALEGRTARVSVRFLSKQISATYAKDNQLVEGSVDRILDMNDVWTFARDTASRDPNWKLIATESGH